MRFALDKKSNNKYVITPGLQYLVYGSFVVIAVLGINHAFSLFGLFKQYSLYFFLMFFSQALSGILISYARGIEKISDLSLSSIINSAVIIICNILFLLIFKCGLIGYFWANIIGPFIQCTYLAIITNAIRDVRVCNKDKLTAHEMIAYSKPMIANSIGWWINNAADKYVVIYFSGMSENGIYAVAAKIPSILNIFQSIFAQAWTISAVKDYDPEDKNGFFAKTYATYNCLMTIGCSALILVDKPLAKFLYAKDFYAAWRYVPYLTIAILFGALAGYLGGFFSAAKNSKIFAQSTLIGSVVNIFLNFTLTPQIGAMGAAIATCISYIIVWIVRFIHSKKYIKLRVKLKRDFFSYFALLVQAIVLLTINGIWLYVIELFLIIIVIVLYLPELHLLTEKVKNVLIKKIKQ